MRLALDLLQPNPDQPRKHFNEGAIASLAQSIRNHGLLQPIVVRPLKEGGGRYEIIAGERRWHAASLAGLRVVPVIVREMEDSIALQAALVENLQREDLSPVEEARAYERLVAVFGLSHEDVASVVAKSRPHITNMVRLLGLPEVVLRALDQGVLSPAHGRLLLQSPHPLRHTRLIIERKLTVAAFDRLLKLESRRGGDREAGNGAGLPDWLKDIAGAFAYHLGEKTGVRTEISLSSMTRGRLVFQIDNADQLRRLTEALVVHEMERRDPIDVELDWERQWRRDRESLSIEGTREDTGEGESSDSSDKGED